MQRLLVTTLLFLCATAHAAPRKATFTVEIFDSGERVKSDVRVETLVDASDYAELTIDGARSGTIEASFAAFDEGGTHLRVPLVLQDHVTNARLAVGQSANFSVGTTTITLTLERLSSPR